MAVAANQATGGQRESEPIKANDLDGTRPRGERRRKMHTVRRVQDEHALVECDTNLRNQDPSDKE